jgi:hypothetical protein
MKHCLLSATFVFTLLFARAGYAQKSGLPYDRFTGEITQTNIVQSRQTKEKIFHAIKAWIVKTYPNHREIVRTENMNTGRIVFEDVEPISSPSFKSFSYVVTIDVKDGGFSCKINKVKTLSAGSAAYTSADMDFSTMGVYGQDIDDLDREISITRNKKELAKLERERHTIKSFLRDYDKSHSAMNTQFEMIQNGIRRAVLTGSSLAAK